MDNELTVDIEVTAADQGTTGATEAEIADELLIEEISIDGMCGVY